MSEAEALLQLLDKGSTFWLTMHEHPDGDAVGSLIALGMALNDRGKSVTMVSQEPVPEEYSFLEGAGAVVQAEEQGGQNYDAAIFVDCTSPERSGKNVAMITPGTTLVNIDHHISNTRFGTINLVQPEAAATGEILYHWFTECGWEISPRVATALYVALVTDTGSFKHQNTTPEAHQAAAELLRLGADHCLSYRHLYEERSRSGLALTALALETLSFACGGRIAWMTVTPKMIADSGSDPQECEGLVDYPKSVRGVELGLLFKEFNPGEVRVSLRSKEWLDVNRLAAKFGGGGHIRAAGCTLNASLTEAVKLVVAAATPLFREQGVS